MKVMPFSNRVKPIFTGCDRSCYVPGSKECWQLGHIPYAGYLASRFHTKGHAAMCVFERYVMMKKVVWPDEVVNFTKLWVEKHRELPLRAFSNSYGQHCYWGAYYHGEYRIYNLFSGIGRGLLAEGVLFGEPFSPNKEDRDSVFFNLSLKLFVLEIKSHEYNRQFNYKQFTKNQSY